MQSDAERKLTDRADVRHLLRRLAFGATESLESAVTGLTVDEAVDALVNGAKRAPRPVPPPFVLTEWTNTACCSPTPPRSSRRLEAPSGYEPDRAVDPEGFRSQRRTGLRPVFEAAHFVDRPKTILGRRDAFNAASAVGYLARHPDTARRYGRLLMGYLGVEDPDGTLERQLATTYRGTGGSLVALVREIAGSEAFWSRASRWALVKSPIHLAVGGCRQLEVSQPPLAALGTWLAAAGQKLFQTPAGLTQAQQCESRIAECERGHRHPAASSGSGVAAGTAGIRSSDAGAGAGSPRRRTAPPPEGGADSLKD